MEVWIKIIYGDNYRKFHDLLYNDYKEDDEEIYNEPIIAFAAALTPCWKYNKDTKELEKEQEIGVIFSNGVNFESKNTPDFKTFFGVENKNALIKHIQEITDCLIDSAYKLMSDNNYTSCNLRIPALGLSTFAKEYEDKEELAKIYLNAIFKSLQRHTNKYISFYVDFFNYDGTPGYDKAYKENAFKNKATNIFTDLHIKKSIFDKNTKHRGLKDNNELDLSKILTIIAHAGDPHSFLGNGGYKDPTLERCLVGYENKDFLTAIHLVNLLLDKIINIDNKEKKKLNEKQLRKPIKYRSVLNINNIAYILLGCIIVITLLYIQYKKLIDKFLNTHLQLFKKRL
jgi:hypothetical protein